MTIEATETTPEPDFAAFEAAANEPEAPVEKDEPNPEVNDEAKPLDLTDEDELVEDEEGAEKKTRSKSARQRIDEITAARRTAERERDDLRTQLEALQSGKPAPTETKAPNPDDYEFGEVDPKFITDSIQHGVKAALAEERANASQEAQVAETRQTLDNLDHGWSEKEAKGVEKYSDFSEKIEDFKANAPCPPLLAIAIQASDVGDDAAYHLANNQDEAHLIAALLDVGTPDKAAEAAERFGAIEGQYMDKRPTPPARDAHFLDKAIYAGRLRAFIDKGTKPTGKIVTDAPEPHKKQVRGAGGQFETGADTTDFAAFERKAKASAGR